MDKEVVITRKISDVISDKENIKITLTNEEVLMAYLLHVKKSIFHDVNWYNYALCDSKLSPEQMEDITNEIMEKINYNNDEYTEMIECTVCDFLDSEDLLYDE